MFRTMLSLLAVAAVVGMGAPALAGGCKGCDKVTKTGEGFCCGKGKAFGVDISSKKLVAALAGHKFDEDNIKCKGCKYAAKTSGKCSHCNVAAAHGKFYHSNVAYTLAKGTPVSAEKASSCSGCKSAHTDSGFCKGCGVGFVAGRMFKGEENYKAAVTAHATLVKAASAVKKCEACAIAMVNDGTCDHCKVSFKEGKATS